MMTNCHLFQMEFSPENNVSSDTPISESELEHIGTNKFDHWHKNESGYFSKMQVTLDVFDALDR